MGRCWKPFLLLLLIAVAALNTQGGKAADVRADTTQVKKSTNKLLEVIPQSGNSSSVTKLMLRGGRISLTEADGRALATYPNLTELYLDGNRVSSITAKYFSVVPHLTVLSLSKNNISSLDPESFSSLVFLKKLDLSNNLLTSLHTLIFRELSNLQMLHLQGNPWNCSCPQLSTIDQVTAGGVTIGSTDGQKAVCAFPEKQAGRDLLEATAECYPTSTITTTTTQPPKPPTPANVRKSWSSSTRLKTTLNQNKDIKNGPTPVSGNTWKFAACVAALALCMCLLILCAIKGPSWYKLFHNYRHQQLHSTEDETGIVSTVFSRTGRHLKHQTFSFQRENRRIEEAEEEEDGYYEDPYVKREE